MMIEVLQLPLIPGYFCILCEQLANADERTIDLCKTLYFRPRQIIQIQFARFKLPIHIRFFN